MPLNVCWGPLLTQSLDRVAKARPHFAIRTIRELDPMVPGRSVLGFGVRGSDLFKTPCSPLTSPAEPSLCQISKSLLHKHCFFLLHYALQEPRAHSSPCAEDTELWDCERGLASLSGFWFEEEQTSGGLGVGSFPTMCHPDMQIVLS